MRDTGNQMSLHTETEDNPCFQFPHRGEREILQYCCRGIMKDIWSSETDIWSAYNHTLSLHKNRCTSEASLTHISVQCESVHCPYKVNYNRQKRTRGQCSTPTTSPTCDAKPRVEVWSATGGERSNSLWKVLQSSGRIWKDTCSNLQLNLDPHLGELA